MLAEQPAALEEAQKAVPYHYATLAIVIPSTVYSIMLFADVLSQANSNSLAGINEASNTSDRLVAVTLLSSVAAGLLSIAARNHMFKSEGLFNEALAAPDSSGDRARWTAHAARILPDRFSADPVRGRYGIGWSFGTPRGW